MAVGMDESSYVPRGIDADSWLGFEQRIQQRRFQALLDIARKALAAGDRQAAASALTEARDLSPDADELSALEVQTTKTQSSRWKHAPHLVATLAVGVAVVLALNSLRSPVEAPAPATSVAEQSVDQSIAPPVPQATTGVTDAPTSVERRSPGPSALAPETRPDPPPTPAAPLTEEGRVAFALRRYARTFTGFNFADCAIAMRGTEATAACRAVPASAPASMAGDWPIWDVELSLHDEGWMIDRALAREK